MYAAPWYREQLRYSYNAVSLPSDNARISYIPKMHETLLYHQVRRCSFRASNSLWNYAWVEGSDKKYLAGAPLVTKALHREKNPPHFFDLKKLKFFFRYIEFSSPPLFSSGIFTNRNRYWKNFKHFFWIPSLLVTLSHFWKFYDFSKISIYDRPYVHSD